MRQKNQKESFKKHSWNVLQRTEACLWTTEATDKTPTTISNFKIYYSKILGQNGKQAVIMEN